MVTKSKPQLVKELECIQSQREVSDYKFAKTLGVDRILWYATKRGTRNIGLTLLRAILRTYPELTDEVINYLRDGDNQ